MDIGVNAKNGKNAIDQHRERKLHCGMVSESDARKSSSDAPIS